MRDGRLENIASSDFRCGPPCFIGILIIKGLCNNPHITGLGRIFHPLKKKPKQQPTRGPLFLSGPSPSQRAQLPPQKKIHPLKTNSSPLTKMVEIPSPQISRTPKVFYFSCEVFPGPREWNFLSYRLRRSKPAPMRTWASDFSELEAAFGPLQGGNRIRHVILWSGEE